MTSFQLRRLKRRLVRQAVAENLIDREAGPSAGSRSDRMVRLRRPLLWLVAPLLVVTGYLLAARPGAAPPELFNVVPGVMVPAITPDSANDTDDRPAQRPGPAAVFDPEVLVLPVWTVVLDPGHGGDNTGTMAPGGLVEKELTLDLSERVRHLLESSGFQVLMTRREDLPVSLEERASLANEQGGDVLVSIHVNWFPDRRQRGVETYYLGNTSDPELERLAALENRDSGYSLADLRQMLDGIYSDLRSEESRRLAQAVQDELFATLHAIDPSIADRGVKQAPFVVLTAARVPAILAEVSCLSNRDEVERLQDPDYRQQISEALFRGLLAYADTRFRPIQVLTPVPAPRSDNGE